MLTHLTWMKSERKTKFKSLEIVASPSFNTRMSNTFSGAVQITAREEGQSSRVDARPWLSENSSYSYTAADGAGLVSRFRLFA